jgi:transposase-like protein
MKIKSIERLFIKAACPTCPVCRKKFPRNERERACVIASYGTLEEHYCSKAKKSQNIETKKPLKKETTRINPKKVSRMSCQTCGNTFLINSSGYLEEHNCNNPNPTKKEFIKRMLSGGGANGTGKRR